MTIEMRAEEYAKLTGHSIQYVKTYIARGKERDKVHIRIMNRDLIDSIYDFEGE